MALQLSAVIDAARSQSAAFDKSVVPDKVAADFLTGYQRSLVGKGVRRDRGYLTQVCAIGISVSSANAPGTVGAGTGGGVPLSATATTSAIPTQTGAGGLAELETDPVVLVSERVASAVTQTTLSYTGAGWTVNAYVDQLIEITAGPGLGTTREIISNTSDTVTVADWEANNATKPSTASLFRIVAPAIETDDTTGVVTQIPALETRRGYLVKLNSAGVAYLDYTAPVVVRTDTGVALPAHHGILGGTIRYADDTTGEDSEPLTLVRYGQRFEAPVRSAYVQSDTLYLCGTSDDWSDVEGLDIRYTPVPPALTSRTDYLLVPDAAYHAVVMATAAFMAVRVAGLRQPGADAGALASLAAEAEAAYLDEIAMHRRGIARRIRDVS